MRGASPSFLKIFKEQIQIVCDATLSFLSKNPMRRALDNNPVVQELHADAVLRGDDTYEDPNTGFTVGYFFHCNINTFPLSCPTFIFSSLNISQRIMLTIHDFRTGLYEHFSRKAGEVLRVGLPALPL